jgi:hypothetical protein
MIEPLVCYATANVRMIYKGVGFDSRHFLMPYQRRLQLDRARSCRNHESLPGYVDRQSHRHSGIAAVGARRYFCNEPQARKFCWDVAFGSGQ